MMRISSRSHIRPNCVTGTSPRNIPSPLLPPRRRSSSPYTAPAVLHTSRSTDAALPPPPRSSPVLPAVPAYLPSHRPPGSSNSLLVHHSQTTCENSHPSAPVPRNAPSPPAAPGAPSVSAPGSTDLLPASSAAVSPHVSPPGLRSPGAHWPVSAQVFPLLRPSTSSAAMQTPAPDTSSAWLDWTLSPHCGASIPLHPPFHNDARSASPAGSSGSRSLPRRPTSAFHSPPGPALPPAAVLSCSSVSFPAKTSSGAFSLGDISNEIIWGHYQSGATQLGTRVIMRASLSYRSSC